jgi:homocitrate synthase NifV
MGGANMALFLSSGRVLKIIDRTLPEILYRETFTNNNKVYEFCRKLGRIGVDLIEIDSCVAEKLGKLPEGINFLYRMESEHDLQECIRKGIRFCVVKWAKLSEPDFSKAVTRNGLKVTAEFEAGNIDDLYRLRRLLKSDKMGKASSIRIVGMEKVTSQLWVSLVRSLRRQFKINIDICPKNTYSLATSIAFEAAMGGVEAVTLSFAGYGREGGFAAIEELIMAIKLEMGSNYRTRLKVLPELSRIFSEIGMITIPGNKPVLGKDIFKYESGVHADGIEKEPSTYEPYEPNEVGLQRKLIIGKHSGKKSVLKKIRELDQDIGEWEINSVVDMVRKKSIELKRELNDGEFKDLLMQLCI